MFCRHVLMISLLIALSSAAARSQTTDVKARIRALEASLRSFQQQAEQLRTQIVALNERAFALRQQGVELRRQYKDAQARVEASKNRLLAAKRGEAATKRAVAQEAEKLREEAVESPAVREARLKYEQAKAAHDALQEVLLKKAEKDPNYRQTKERSEQAHQSLAALTQSPEKNETALRAARIELARAELAHRQATDRFLESDKHYARLAAEMNAASKALRKVRSPRLADAKATAREIADRTIPGAKAKTEAETSDLRQSQEAEKEAMERLKIADRELTRIKYDLKKLESRERTVQTAIQGIQAELSILRRG